MTGERSQRFGWVAHDSEDHLQVHYLEKTEMGEYQPDGSRQQVKVPGVVRFIHPDGHFDFTQADFEELAEVVAEIFEANEGE